MIGAFQRCTDYDMSNIDLKQTGTHLIKSIHMLAVTTKIEALNKYLIVMEPDKHLFGEFPSNVQAVHADVLCIRNHA